MREGGKMESSSDMGDNGGLAKKAEGIILVLYPQII